MPVRPTPSPEQRLADPEVLLQALRRQPDDAALACDLADAFAAKGQLTKALLVYQHALEQSPTLVRACYGAGCAEIARQEFVPALAWFRKAVELAPEWLEARHNLARALYELGEVSEAFAHFKACGQLDSAASKQSRAMAALIAPAVPELKQLEILEIRRSWAERDLPPAGPMTPRQMGTPLRVGYVSSFFHHDHWMKPVWGLIRQHDLSRIRPVLFSDAPLQSTCEVVDTSQLSNDDMARIIQQYAIDVLVDLNGYSNMRRLPLFASRIAPVMLGWFNLYATTGIANFDYLIGDAEAVKPDEEEFYSEKILCVTGSYLTFEVNYAVPPVAERELQAGGIVYGAMASAYKITDEVIAVWSRILQANPESSLLLKNKHLSSAQGREYLLARFARQGIMPGRLQLEGPEDHFQFLQAYDRVDVALDTFPYNGGTTTTEAIWQGVPVITFYGDRWASRTSASILRAAGLGEFVASDMAAYVDLAASIKSRERLGLLRRNMRTQLRNSAVCDTPNFARQMEQLYFSARATAL